MYKCYKALSQRDKVTEGELVYYAAAVLCVVTQRYRRGN